jgi:uncharacterized Rmd1/YagE family protein
MPREGVSRRSTQRGDSMTESSVGDASLPAISRRNVHALLLGDRIETSGLERAEVMSTVPVTFRGGQDGLVSVFRYGVVVLFGLSVLEEDEILRGLAPRIVRPVQMREDETASIQIAPDKDEQVLPGGPILLRTITLEHVLVIADAISKSVVLARFEREVASVFETIEPFARRLAEKGRTRGGRRALLKQIGSAMLVQHRVSGRFAVTEKPDAVWDRPDLDRLYSRLQDEYELKERTEALSRKLTVISDTAELFADMIDTQRSLRMEILVAILILFEIVITMYQIVR